MHNTWILFKTDLLIYYNRLNKMSKSKKRGTLILFALLGFIVIGQLTTQSYVMLKPLLGTGAERFILDSQLFTLFLLSLVFSFSNSLLLKEKDSDFLLSLPLQKKEIIAAKFLFKLAFSFLISLLIVMPICILYFVAVKKDVLLLVLSFFVLLLLSIAFVGFEFMFHAIINRFAMRFRSFQTVKTLLGIAAVIALLGAYVFYTVKGGMQASSAIPRYFVISAIVDIFVEHKLLPLLALFLGSAVFATFGILLYSFFYGKQAKSYKNPSKEITVRRQSPVLWSMVKKELWLYFHSSAYLMNTFIGYLILLAAAVAVFFIDIEQSLLLLIAYFISCFSLSTCSTTNCSISLEGKNLWIYKSAPVTPMQIIYSKVCMNLCLIVPTVTVAFALLAISAKIPLLSCLLLYLLILSSGLVVALVGIIANLLLPKLDYENEMKVVKQSASVVATLLPLMVINVLFPFLYYILTFEGYSVNINLYIACNAAFMLLVAFGCILLLKKKGAAWFAKIS